MNMSRKIQRNLKNNSNSSNNQAELLEILKGFQGMAEVLDHLKSMELALKESQDSVARISEDYKTLVSQYKKQEKVFLMMLTKVLGTDESTIEKAYSEACAECQE